MNNNIRATRLENEYARLTKMESQCEFFRIKHTVGNPPENYVFEFARKTLVHENGQVREFEGGVFVEVYLPQDYPRSGPQFRVVSPKRLYHPNVAPGVGLICMGEFSPNLWIENYVETMDKLFSWNLFTMAENTSLNADAARYARNHQDMFPIDNRSLIAKNSRIKVY